MVKVSSHRQHRRVEVLCESSRVLKSGEIFLWPASLIGSQKFETRMSKRKPTKKEPHTKYLTKLIVVTSPPDGRRYVVGRLSEFYFLTTFMVTSGWVAPCDSVHTWSMYSAYPTGRPSHQHPELTCHSFTLSWHWAKQSLIYPGNT